MKWRFRCFKKKVTPGKGMEHERMMKSGCEGGRRGVVVRVEDAV